MKLRLWTRFCAILLVGSALLFPLAVYAGRNCDQTAPDAGKTQKGIRFATQLRESLELTGASLVLVGRIGSDQSQRGLRYTHAGYLFRSHPSGSWTVVHELNNCNSGNSELFDEGLANFYMDEPFEYETRIVIPSPELQEKLAKVLLSPMKRVLHHPTYSSIAYPWSTKYQNSNGWVLEILATAMAGPEVIRNREMAQRWLKDNGYQPSRMHIGAGERAGARLFSPNIRFGDHPDADSLAQNYEVNTGDSVIEFFRQIDPGARLITQRLDGRAVVAQKPGIALPPAIVAVKQVEPIAPVVAIAPVSPPINTALTSSSQTRAKLLQSMQGLIVSYACRPQGYLSQCRQMERVNCEKQVSDAVLRCFATVSDQQLMNGTEQVALEQMQEIGYCAVEGADSNFAATGKPARTLQGKQCPSVRNYK